ncbi:MAG: hypothetical protein AABX07_01095 [Nanoarchaeota archaeon]
MNVKNLVLGVGIFIVYMLMLNYGIEAFYPSLQYDNYCSASIYKNPYQAMDGKNCTNLNKINEIELACYSNRGQPVNYSYDSSGCVQSLSCDFCSKQFDESRKSYSKVVFVIALIAGILTLLIGYGILSVEPVGSALMASGVGAIFYGSVRNWMNLSDVWRFLLLLLALVLLIWIALRLNRKK